MRILLTNDDGIHAEGLRVLRAAMETKGHVTVVAPERPRSACSHAITLHKPLHLSTVQLDDGILGYTTNGTPSDCVALALCDLMEEKPDLVISGINLGPNLGDDITYSGTVAAAFEGAIFGVKSFAISVADYHVKSFDYAAKVATMVADAIMEHGLSEETLLNVNVPNLPESEILGIEVTRQGKRRYLGSIEKRIHPRGMPYYWRGGEIKDPNGEPGTDVAAIAAGKVSVTPLQIDMTNHAAQKILASWRF